MSIRRILALLAAAALIVAGYHVLTPPEVVHEFSKSTNLRAPNETLRARVGDDFTEIFPLPSGIRVEKDVGVMLPDGTRMSVNIYRPDTNDRVPVVIWPRRTIRSMGAVPDAAPAVHGSAISASAPRRRSRGPIPPTGFRTAMRWSPSMRREPASLPERRSRLDKVPSMPSPRS